MGSHLCADALWDISHKKLEKTIAEKLGVSYLSKAKESDARNVIDGCYHCKGEAMRAIVPLVVSSGDEVRLVPFVIGCAVRPTFLSRRVSAAAVPVFLEVLTSAG